MEKIILRLVWESPDPMSERQTKAFRKFFGEDAVDKEVPIKGRLPFTAAQEAMESNVHALDVTLFGKAPIDLYGLQIQWYAEYPEVPMIGVNLSVFGSN